MNLTIWLFGEFKPRHCGRGLHVSGLRVPRTIAGAHPSAPPFPVWAGTCPSVVHRRPTAVSGPSSMCGAAPIPTPYPVFHPRCATLKGAEPPQLKPPLPLQPPHSELPPPTTVVLRHRPLLTPRPTLVLQSHRSSLSATGARLPPSTTVAPTRLRTRCRPTIMVSFRPPLLAHAVTPPHRDALPEGLTVFGPLLHRRRPRRHARGHPVVTTGGACAAPRSVARPLGSWLGRAHRPTQPCGQQREPGRHAIRLEAVGRGRPHTVHPVFIFPFSFTFLENHRNFKNL
jgi:hypothetical protein